MKNLFTKILVLVLVLATTVASFAGCKKKKGDSGADNPTDKITITVAVNGTDPSEGALMNAWKTDYEKINTKVKIKIENFTSDYTQSMLQYVQSPSSMPDIIWTTGEKHAVWSENGAFLDLKTIDSALDTSDFYEEIVNATHIDSRDTGIYFMPRDYNKCVLFINKTMFRAAGFTDEEINGLKDGWNYEKFIATCERLETAMQSDANPTAGIRANSVPVDARMDFNASYCSFMKHYGGEFIVDGEIDFLTDANIQAYGKIYELIKNNYIADSARKNSATFTTLSAAMYIGVRPALPGMPQTANYDIDFLPLPLDHVGVGCSGYAITMAAKQRVSGSNYNEGKKTNDYYAYDFLKYISSIEGQRIGAQTGSIVPVRKSMANDSSWTSYMSASLNHGAFISAPEKDFSLNIFQDFNADDAATIMDSLSKVMAQVIIAKNYENYELNNYALLREAISGFQNGVKDLRPKY